MTSPHHEDGLRSLRTLFHAGTGSGLTDGQLLERFATRGGEASEPAFAALVERHGPMVLRTCRAVLRDEHAAQDAFQATFLILVRRGGTLWVRHSLGPWLHRVACRVAARARRDAERRMSVERRAAEMADRSLEEVGRDELGGTLQEEVDRLPDRYRIPVVLCDLEGHTYEEVAHHLGCPVGTVKSRLARGREQLRDRLIRRGLVPADIAQGAAYRAREVQAAVPGILAETTVQAAIRFAAVKTTAAGLVSASVATLVEGVLRSMFLTKLKTAAWILLAVGVTWGGLVAGAGARPQQRPEREPAAPTAVKSPPPPAQAALPRIAPVASLAWRRTDVYEAPDFERFFPDDPEGGKALDALWAASDRDQRPDAEILRIVRQGLRHTKVPTEIVRWIGGRYIWGKPPQNPDAIEITYHAVEFPPTRNWSIYFGLSVVQPMPPAILRTLADLCMISDDPNDLERVAWGAKAQRAEILSYLKPYLDADDEATRGKAADVAKILRGELKAFAWAAERTKVQAQAKYAGRLPEIKKMLQEGNTQQRKDALLLVAVWSRLTYGRLLRPRLRGLRG